MLAIALSGGAAWGIAHIGVLQVLEDEGISVDLVTGTSAGSLVGALWTGGITAHKMEELLDGINWATFGRLVFPKLGLFDSTLLEDFVSEHLGADRTFEDLAKPLAVVATDLYSGTQVVIDSGPVAPAVRASCAIPMVFTPLEYQGKLLVDGGLVNNLPVSAAVDRGADSVIAVNLKEDTISPEHVTNQWEVGIRALNIMHNRATLIEVRRSDVLISPRVSDISPSSFKDNECLLERGREAAREALPAVQKLLQKA